MPLLLPLGALLAFLGYVGPWVDHRVAGLAVLGLDLGEYVKFLPGVRAGATGLWREGFYLPLVAISLTLSLCTWRVDVRWPSARGRAGYAIIYGVRRIGSVALSPKLAMRVHTLLS